MFLASFSDALDASQFVHVESGWQTMSVSSKDDMQHRNKLIITHNRFALKVLVEQERAGAEHSFGISVLGIEFVDSASMRKALSKSGLFVGAVLKLQTTSRASAALLAREFIARMEKALRRVKELDEAVCVE
jgi:hypothetical protein